MSLPRFQVGDSFLLDHTFHNVVDVFPYIDQIGCEFHRTLGQKCYHRYTYYYLLSAYGRGLLTSWVLEERRPENTHKHDWKIYRGLNVVEKYCDCGEKQNVDWKEIK